MARRTKTPRTRPQHKPDGSQKPTTYWEHNKPTSGAPGSAATCDWKFFADYMKRCPNPATAFIPLTGLKYCAAHARRFHGMEDLVPIKQQNSEISRLSPAHCWASRRI